MTQNRKKIDIYSQNLVVEVESASPHRLIQLLMEGLLTRINAAKFCINANDIEGKAKCISQAIAIVGGLNESLNMELGGEISANLRSLYGYMSIILYEASSENNIDKLEEVASLMRNIKEAWDIIG